MGMSIDKAIIHINNSSLRAYDPEVADMAIDTMRKYQKIEDIMHIEMNGKEALQEIERILRG